MLHASNRWIPSVLIALVACLAACQQQPQATPDTRAADESAIRDLDVQWSRATGSKNVQQFVSYFADDATFLPPNVPTITSKDGIQKWGSEVMGNPGFAVSWQPAAVQVSRGGDLGYTRGTYELKLTGPKGKLISDHGKYLTLWKKQADGGWKVAVDIFNSDLPAEGATAR